MSRPGASLALSPALAIVLALCACLPACAGAAPTAEINAKLTPERLGAATTVSLGFQIAANGSAPAALSAIQLVYPSNLGLATSGLGLASCSPAELEAMGSAACPPNSRMGSGSGIIEMTIASAEIDENVSLELFAAPSTDGYLHVLVYVNGLTPVIGQAVLSGVLLPGHLSIVVPPIPSFPEAPDIALARMRLTLGGRLTYYERVAGRLVAYHPAGVGLPSSCPSGGFPFAATFAFLDGSQSSAHTAVPCPRHR